MMSVRTADWHDPCDRQALESIRREVFVEEQGVSIEEEMDSLDATSQHLLAISHDSEWLGCARVVSTGQIGRMAVRKGFRGQGIGGALMEAAIKCARQQQASPIFLHAQRHAENFYAQFGFTSQGEAFDEAGIDHIKMELRQ